MTLSAIISDATLVLDGVVASDVVWPVELYGSPIQNIHAVQAYNTHTEVEYVNPDTFNQIFRDAAHTTNLAVLESLHAATIAAQPTPASQDPAVMARMDKLMQAERDYGQVEFQGHKYHATPTLYAQTNVLKGLGKVYFIDVELQVVELTAVERAALRELIGPQLKLMLHEYKKLLDL